MNQSAPKLVSKFKSYDWLAALYGIPLIIVSFFAFRVSFEEPYLQIFEFLFGLFFSSLVVFNAIGIIQKDIIEIYDDRIELKSRITGKTKRSILLSDLSFWFEEKTNKEIFLYLHLITSSYRIEGSNYKNFEELRYHLTHGLPLDETKHEVRIGNAGLKYFQVACLIIGIFFLYFAFHLGSNRSGSINNTLVGLKDKIEQTDSHKGNVTIHLASHPNFTFRLDHNSYTEKENSATFMVNVKANDSVEIFIRKRDFITKIKKQKEPDFFDKIINYRFIDVYGLREGKEIYLSPKDFYQSQDDTSWGMWTCIVLSVVLLLLGLPLFADYDDKPASQLE